MSTLLSLKMGGWVFLESARVDDGEIAALQLRNEPKHNTFSITQNPPKPQDQTAPRPTCPTCFVGAPRTVKPWVRSGPRRSSGPQPPSWLGWALRWLQMGCGRWGVGRGGQERKSCCWGGKKRWDSRVLFWCLLFGWLVFQLFVAESSVFVLFFAERLQDWSMGVQQCGELLRSLIEVRDAVFLKCLGWESLVFCNWFEETPAEPACPISAPNLEAVPEDGLATPPGSPDLFKVKNLKALVLALFLFLLNDVLIAINSIVFPCFCYLKAPGKRLKQALAKKTKPA